MNYNTMRESDEVIGEKFSFRNHIKAEDEGRVSEKVHRSTGSTQNMTQYFGALRSRREGRALAGGSHMKRFSLCLTVKKLIMSLKELLSQLSGWANLRTCFINAG